MSKIVIKKTISLDFLGEDYKEGYLIFKSIPLREYEKYQKKIASAKDNESEAANTVISILNDNFLAGKFPDEKGELFDITKDELEDFDIGTAVKVFAILTGQDQSPKS